MLAVSFFFTLPNNCNYKSLVTTSPFFITGLSDNDGGFAADSLMLLKKNLL
jgi:hypothetical protein